MSDTVYVIYHADCYDGFGAAWAAWRALKDNGIYLPCRYGDPLPELPDGAVVAMVDISWPRATLEALATRCHLDVLDHHKTARADLEGLQFATFAEDKSGAVLAWEWWHQYKMLPKLLAYVQDRDLWRFELPRSREVAAWMRSYPMDFEQWNYLSERIARDFGEVIAEGCVILRFQGQQVEAMCQHARVQYVGGFFVPVANATVFFSEVGERLCELYPNAPFAVYYLDRADGTRQWGLRSRVGFDVSQVAKSYGGGGHTAAAGFVLQKGQEP